jgi:formate hydrogenlyase transcriptional activator
MYRIHKVAPTGTTVLLTGETGTGKGIFARLIHRLSDRRDKPFVNVNCAGLPTNLIESELFGREKGAFTGSTARQIGRFELANGGTIFLDEIGELHLELQAKLLKVIEDREFERLGSPHPVKVDVRVIASTNRNLEEEIKRGKFRQDLYYRLSVFPVTIPPLRHRKEDIQLLVRAYVKRFRKAYQKDIKSISKKTMEFLENYAWPGNVRELINVIERAVIVSDGPELRLAEKTDAVPVESVREERPTLAALRETKSLAEAEREHILRTLQETGWRIEGQRGAAQLLHIHPNTLRARMKKLGVKRPGR